MKKLTYQEEQVYMAIPAGKQNAISRKDLMHKLELSDRDMRDIMNRLSRKLHIVVSHMNGRGYFRPDTWEEYDAYERTMRSYSRSNAQRADDVHRAKVERFGARPEPENMK